MALPIWISSGFSCSVQPLRSNLDADARAYLVEPMLQTTQSCIARDVHPLIPAARVLARLEDDIAQFGIRSSQLESKLGFQVDQPIDQEKAATCANLEQTLGVRFTGIFQDAFPAPVVAPATPAGL